MASDACLLDCLRGYNSSSNGAQDEALRCIDSCQQSTIDPETLAYTLIGALALVMLSALFSGLTLGLMSMDKQQLQIIMDSGDPVEREHARIIAPVREDGNLLLCTLLLGNTATNAFLSILLADLTDGIQGLLLSTGLIVIFGEIAPQALCSRYGLAIGAYTIYITRFFIVLLFIAAYPISKVLDLVLGWEVGTVYCI